MSKPMAVERVAASAVKDFGSYVAASRPVVLVDLAECRQAVGKWTPDYFSAQFGEVKAVVMRTRGNYCDVDTYDETDSGKNTVAAAIGSWSSGTAKRQVIASPVECFPPHFFHDYATPAIARQGKFLRNRIYIGPRGIITSLHQDLPENLYVQISGAKRITLFAPADKKYLYPHSLFSKHPNFSRVELSNPDLEKFPLFKKATPLVVELQAGEALFIPSLWWHHLENMEDSVAMNFWWSVGWKAAVAWGAAMYKRTMW